MRGSRQQWGTGPIRDMASNVWRRRDWFIGDVSAGQLANLAVAGSAFAAGRERTMAAPMLLKIDISPVCNLRCTYCVHAHGDDMHDEILDQQSFSSTQRMSVEQLERIVAEVRGKTSAVALYYVGDPLVHPQLDRMCAVVAAAGMRSHVSTNFSFVLSDARLESLVRSGLTHLTASVESLDQERYSRTRVGGRVDLVLGNVERVLEIRNRLGQVHPRVEVQFLKYQHNLDELDEIARWCESHGVDQFTSYWANLHNYADIAPERVQVGDPLRREIVPRCAWPWFSMQILWDGRVIPCCYHRVSEQYRHGGDHRAVGNVFDDGVLNVWRSMEYQRLRRLARNPARTSAADPQTNASFCYGCPQLYVTTEADQRRSAEDHTWESVYFRPTPHGVERI